MNTWEGRLWGPMSKPLRSKPLEFGGGLQPHDHNLIINKLVSVHEDSLATLHHTQKAGPKISIDTLWTYRFVVTAWTRTLSLCCTNDLKATDLENVKDAVLNGDVSCLQ